MTLGRYKNGKRIIRTGNSAIDAAADAVAALYDVHAAGGLAHAVVDDMNVNDDAIDQSIAWIGETTGDGNRSDMMPEESLAALRALRPLTEAQRVRAINLAIERNAPEPSEYQQQLADKLRAIVEREVKAAHGDILKDLAESEMARKESELEVSDLRRELAIARRELNALRGVTA